MLLVGSIRWANRIILTSATGSGQTFLAVKFERLAIAELLQLPRDETIHPNEMRSMDAPQPWHRLFGLTLVDFFRGMPVIVELEKDLSLKQ